MNRELNPLPKNWSTLTWQQLCDVWAVKQRYGGNADVARVAAMFVLAGCSVCRDSIAAPFSQTGEMVYRLRDANNRRWTVTPRTAAHLAKQSLSWFDYPYGDPGVPEQKDDKGNVINEKREPVSGYVSSMRDAMILPTDYVTVQGSRLTVPFSIVRCSSVARMKRFFSLPSSLFSSKTFALPQVACNNLTWQQYRSLQAIAPQLFADGITDEQATELQARFLAHILTPRTFALLDTFGGSIRLRPHYEYKYNAEQAEGLAKWLEKKMKSEAARLSQRQFSPSLTGRVGVGLLFPICFQTYQTALSYYAASYPLLFSDSGKTDPLRDALTGEVGTINTIMKYAGYSEQQQVYDSNLPFVLDILNTMTKEAKEIEKMNAKMKKK